MAHIEVPTETFCTITRLSIASIPTPMVVRDGL